MNHEIQTMKLAVTLLSCSVVLAKVPHKVDDLEEMDEDDRKQFDDDIFTFNEDGVRPFLATRMKGFRF